MCSLFSCHLCTSERQRRELVAVETAARMLQGKRYTGQYGEKARARALLVARGNKWSGREPGPLCRAVESTRVRPAQRLTKPTSIDRMKIEPMEHRAMVETRTGTWPCAHACAHTHKTENKVCKQIPSIAHIYKNRTWSICQQVL